LCECALPFGLEVLSRVVPFLYLAASALCNSSLFESVIQKFTIFSVVVVVYFAHFRFFFLSALFQHMQCEKFKYK
jgi:hypothetical protein